MKPKTPDPVSEDYKRLLDLQTMHAEAVNELAELQNKADDELHSILAEHKDTFADVTVTIRDTEAAMESIALLHPDWFGDAKSVKTPFGVIKFHASSELEIPNEELAVARLSDAIRRGEVTADALALVTRIKVELLEGFSDGQLAALGVIRVRKNNFSAKPAKVSLGKAISSQDEAAAGKALM